MNRPPIETISDAGHEVPRGRDMAVLRAALSEWGTRPENLAETQMRQRSVGRQAQRRARK